MSKMRHTLTDRQTDFLCRFIDRGWLHGTRDDVEEQSAVNKALKLKYLRKELSEVHFTPAGRIALQSTQAREWRAARAN